MNIRKPAVAGQFYPASASRLQSELDGIYSKEKQRIQTDGSEKGLIGGIVPHAGYVFSAAHAMHFFEHLRLAPTQPETVIILNPNHTGLGDAVALDESDAWHTPLGDVKLDKAFAEALGYPENKASHKNEHSGEVMVPLLQYFLNADFEIMPVSLSNQSHKAARELARNIYDTANKLERKITIIASSDFSHFETKATGKKMDDMVIEQILNMDAQSVEKVILKHKISVCGFGPIMSLMEYAQLIAENPKARILSRGSSGDVIPSDEVVDYVCALITKQ